MSKAPEPGIVSELLATAQSASRAHQMLAEAKTARQTDGGGPYGWVSPEQTVEGRAAALIRRYHDALGAIIDRTPERDVKWAGMTARDIALSALFATRAGATR